MLDEAETMVLRNHAVAKLARNMSIESRNTAEVAQAQGIDVQTAVRILLRAAEYKQRHILTADQREDVKRLLLGGHLRDANALLKDAYDRHADGPRETCLICFDEIGADDDFRLGCGHVYCRECMEGFCSAVACPSCPDTNCSYALSEDEIGLAAGDGKKQDFQNLQLRQAVDQLLGRVDCPNPECSNVVLCDSNRARVNCVCAWPSFCSHCRQEYHAHRSCDEVAELREKWVHWLTEGRQRYHDRVEEVQDATKATQAAIDALHRQRDLAADEEYKRQHCKCCPSCGRVVQKLEGCNFMKV
jgi:hypothetical protein